jgi:hypothetical protein
MVSATQDLINQGIDALIISPVKPDNKAPGRCSQEEGHPRGWMTSAAAVQPTTSLSEQRRRRRHGSDYLDKMIQAIGTPKKVASICTHCRLCLAAQRQLREAHQGVGYEVVAS